MAACPHDPELQGSLRLVGSHPQGVWWSTAFPGGVRESRPYIAVTWERLDVSSRPITISDCTNGRTAEDGDFMIGGIDPVEVGCWRVTADYQGARLSHVYEQS